MRTRQVNRDFWKSEDVAELSHSQRLLFIGLWAMADREGMLLYKPRKVSAEIFPYDAIQKKEIEKWMAHLNEVGLIEFGHNGDDVITFIYIPKFNDYQHIHPNEAKSKIKCNYITGNYPKCQPASASTSASTSTSTGDERSNSGELSVAQPKQKEFPKEADQLCQLLQKLMIANDSKAKHPTTKKQWAGWLLTTDLLHRRDGRSWEEIEAVIRWSQDDDFWKCNIHSPAKLRKQFPKLLLDMKRPVKSNKFDVAENNMNAAKSVIREFNDAGELNSCFDGRGVALQRTNVNGQDQGLLDWPGGSGRKSGYGGVEAGDKGVQVFSEASGDSGDSETD